MPRMLEVPKLLAAMILAMAGLQAANAQDERRLVIYHGAPADPMQKLLNEFHRTHPGIEVTNQRSTGIRVYQNFYGEEQAGHHLADLVMISDYPTMQEAIRQGLLAQWKVPTYDRFPEDAHIGSYAYSPYYNEIAVAYNTTKVTPEEVELLKSSWKAITDPRFKGRFTVAPTPCGNCYAGVHMFLDPAMKGYGEAFLKQVAANEPSIYGDTASSLDRIVAGEYDISYWLFETILIPKMEAGAPIRWVHPNPTPVWANTFIGISKNAPHPANARLFMNWLLGEEGAKAMQAIMGAQTTLQGVPDERAVTRESWYDPVKEVYHIDRKRWEEHYDSDMALWKKIVEQGRRK